MIKTQASKVLFNLSESEDDETSTDVMPKVSVSARMAKVGDRFGSNGIRKGLFSGTKEDDDYQLVTPIVTDYKPQSKQKEGISIIKEVEHEANGGERRDMALTLSCPVSRGKRMK